MVSTQNIKEQVIQVIAEKLKKSPDTIKESNTLQDLGADSLDIVEIIMNLEETFAVHIDDQEAERLKTIADVIKYIERLKQEKK